MIFLIDFHVGGITKHLKKPHQQSPWPPIWSTLGTHVDQMGAHGHKMQGSTHQSILILLVPLDYKQDIKCILQDVWLLRSTKTCHPFQSICLPRSETGVLVSARSLANPVYITLFTSIRMLCKTYFTFSMNGGIFYKIWHSHKTLIWIRIM